MKHSVQSDDNTKSLVTPFMSPAYVMERRKREVYSSNHHYYGVALNSFQAPYISNSRLTNNQSLLPDRDNQLFQSIIKNTAKLQQYQNTQLKPTHFPKSFYSRGSQCINHKVLPSEPPRLDILAKKDGILIPITSTDSLTGVMEEGQITESQGGYLSDSPNINMSPENFYQSCQYLTATEFHCKEFTSLNDLASNGNYVIKTTALRGIHGQHRSKRAVADWWGKMGK